MSAQDYSNTETLLDHFHRERHSYPSTIAVEDGTKDTNPITRPKITYAQLDSLSELWSERLHLAGVGPGSIVPLLSSRSISMVAATLAILKLRAAYVPMDVHSWGRDRIDSVLGTVSPKVVVSTSKTGSEVLMKGAQSQDPTHGLDYTVVTLDDSVDRDAKTGEVTIVNGFHKPRLVGSEDNGRGDDLAYMIFTSGTTGKPKGVMIGQRSISRYVKEGGELPFNLNTTRGTRVLLICSVGFDVCAGIMFNAVCNGGTIVLADPPTLETIAKECSVLPLTPSILATLDPTAGFERIEKIFLGGESPPPALIEAWTSENRRLYNSYGPTETTCTATMAELKPGVPATIGYPISYSNVILLDNQGNESSSEGEILISGLGLAHGYFQDAEKTEKLFIMRDGIRYYKTGDYGKNTPYGLQFCGRRDHMVKNRGFLINLEDVELALSSSPKVDRASALMFQGRLSAFVAPISAKEGLREYLGDTVSTFLVPDTVYSLDSFPMTSNGKVDRRALVQILGQGGLATDGENEQVGVTDLSSVEAVRRGFAHVLKLPISQISELSSFKNLGGHSLAAVLLVTTLRRMEFEISVADVLLLDSVQKIASSAKTSPSINRLPDVSSSTSKYENELAQLRQDVATAKGLTIDNVLPMTDMQTKMARASIVTSGLSFIKTSFTFDHAGKGNFPSILKAAWIRLNERHGILRTTFLLSSPRPVQIISPYAQPDWEEIVTTDSRWDSICEREEILDMNDFTNFNEEDSGSLSRVLLVIVPNNRTRFIWTVHHSLIDGWSMANLMSDFSTCLNENQQALPPAPQFADVALSMSRLEFEQREKAISFWKGYLNRNLPPARLRLPESSDINNYRTSTQSQRLTVTVSAIESAANTFSVTPATLLYAAWGIVISRYSGSERVNIGAVLSGRSLPIPGIENIVGPVINTLPLPLNCCTEESSSDSTSGPRTVQGFLQSVFKALCEIIEFQWSSSSLIQDACESKFVDLFQTLFVLQYDFPDNPWGSNAVSAPRDQKYEETTEIPLTILLDSMGGVFNVKFLYRHSFFENFIIHNMYKHFDNVLSALVATAPEEGLESVIGRMLGVDETETLIAQPRPSPEPQSDLFQSQLGSLGRSPKCLAEAIDNIIRNYPENCAVEGLDKSLTYTELDQDTNRIASRMIEHSGPGKVVCIISDGSIEWLLAIVATIRVGAIYCPIDQKLPDKRKSYMISNSQASLIIYTSSKQDRISGSEAIPFLDIKTVLLETVTALSADARRISYRSSDDVACLIYTSGSTGLPKAVQLQHKGILSVISDGKGRLYSRPGQRNAQLLSLGFDCCIKEVFSTLCFGATLVLKDFEDPIAHLKRVDATMATPSLLATLDPSDYANLKVITVAGEATSQSLNDKWAVGGRILINGYGPAECTLICTTARLNPGKKVSIGNAVPGMACYILDKKMRPVPRGVSGEIFMSGTQVTPGYLRNEAETALRFLGNPFYPNIPMFKTGDIGRRLENGEIEYIGREDNLVKLRGFRIDLGEIHSTISRVASAARNVALVVFNGSLFAFVTPEMLDGESLKRDLEGQLPEYAVPSRVIPLAKLPTSTNHKVDSKALRQLLVQREEEVDKKSQGQVQLPRTETERVVAGIWADVLGRDINLYPISLTDRFFEIGGHSLLQIQVSQFIAKKWEINSPLRLVTRHHILQDLCQAIERVIEGKDYANIASRKPKRKPFLDFEPIERTVSLPLSYLEKEMLLNHLISSGSPAGNMTFVGKVRGNINIQAMADSFQYVTAETEVFRSKYLVVNGELHRSQMRRLQVPHVVQTGNIDAFIQGKLNKCFDLTEDPPVDVSIIIESSTQATVVVVMSHVVGDAITMANYLKKVSTSYDMLQSPKNGMHSQVQVANSEKLTYLDWAAWAETTELDAGLANFWKSYLSNLPEPLSLGQPKAIPTYMGLSRSSILPQSLRLGLSQLATRTSTTMHQIVLAGVFLCLQCIDRRDDMLLAAPFTHRIEQGTETMPGLFLDRLIIRLRRAQEDSLSQFLSTVKESSQQSLAHFIPFKSLRKLLELNPSLSNPLFKIMVTYHTQVERGSVLELKGAEVQSIHCRKGGAKFPITFEFTENAHHGVRLDMEYDLGCVSEEIATRLEFALMFTLQLMVLDRPPDEIIKLVYDSFHTTSRLSSEGTILLANGTHTASEGKERTLRPVEHTAKLIQEAISECLGLNEGGVKDQLSFWELGAQSTDAVRLQWLCKKQGVDVSLRDIFVIGTALELAKRATACK
ncbi:gramicidin S synthetase 1 [Talaromyces proteolyticus]|uniref:Gramicidin S synthetase 1 n=1 Tax=Talaromyces proteolyticus TaxID=1131652 RepID=A0AAD4KVW4_9EURO|nr:gramicidin S synthetase 1 [Talaromyces proteolyticus]KAH8702193.1 gramicidin S synthetase 1 [Talaromyces proteolyticus]